MADRVSASITIGGNLPAALRRTFIAIVRSEGLATEWDGALFTPRDMAADAQLRLFAHEVSWGVFRDLESFCEANRLPYVRETAACPGQWGRHRAIFRGEGDALVYDLDERGHVVVDREIVDRLGLLEAIVAHFEQADFAVPPLRVSTDPQETDNG